MKKQSISNYLFILVGFLSVSLLCTSSAEGASFSFTDQQVSDSLDYSYTIQNKEVTIEFTSGVLRNTTLFISNILGQPLKKETHQINPALSNIYKLDLSDLPKGIYILGIYSEKGLIESRKITLP